MLKLFNLFKRKKKKEEEERKRKELLLEKYNRGEILKVDGQTDNVKYLKSKENNIPQLNDSDLPKPDEIGDSNSKEKKE